MKRYTFLLSLLLLLGFSACQDDGSSKVEPDTASLQLEVQLLHEGQPLRLGSQQYKALSGDVYNVELLKFFVSNLKLRNLKDGRYFHEPDSYHLMGVGNGFSRLTFEVKGIPVHAYNQLEFAIGVDNAHNYSMDQVADLNANSNMNWSMGASMGEGFMFLRMEGRLFNKPGEQKAYNVHIGQDHNYRVFTYPYAFEAVPGKRKLVLQVHVEKILSRVNPIDLYNNGHIMFGELPTKVVENYSEDTFLPQP